MMQNGASSIPNLQQGEKNILPCQTFVELEEAEEKLKRPAYYKTLHQILSVIGGKTAQKSIRRMMGKVFGEQLATKCSYTGQKNNFRTQDLKLMSLIKEIAREQFGNISDYEFEKTAKDFFRYAAQRLSRSAPKN